MAELDDALEGADDGAQVADPPENQEPPHEPTASEIAAELGWKPQEEWTGEPDKWKPADQFIRDGREIQQTTARELKAMREQMERLGGVTETIVKDKVAEAQAQWEARLAQAVDEGDTETALKLANKRPAEVPTPSGPDSSVQQWVGRHKWFTEDPLAASVAREVSDRLAKDGYSTADQLAAAEREVKRRFPEHFPQAKQPPATQTAATRNANPSNREKGFNDMPAASQQIARDFQRRHGMKLEDFAKSYWQDQAKEGVRR